MNARFPARCFLPLGILLLASGCGKKDTSSGTDDSGTSARVPEGPVAGHRVDASADLTGDGQPDVLITAPGLEWDGQLLVFDGALTGAVSASQATATVSASAPGDIGEGLSVCGDVTGDGVDDLVLGAPLSNSERGGAWLVAGPLAAASQTADHLKVLGSDRGAAAGHHVTCDGDLDGDGRADIALTAPYADGLGIPERTGQIFFHHVPDTEPEPFASALSTYDDEWMGHDRSIVIHSDLDGDGQLDAIWGGPGQSRLHLVLGPLAGTIDAQLTSGKIRGREDDDQFGHTLATVDLDGDGHDDVVAGAPDYGPQSGAIGIVHGPFNADVDDRVTTLGGRWIDGQDPKEYAGSSLAVASDLSGDGSPDLLVGAPGATTAGPDAGVVYTVFGPAQATTLAAADRVLVSTVPHARFGASVTAVPDVSGDGLDEVLVGAPGLDVDDRIGVGGAFLFHSPLPSRTEQVDATTTFGF